MDIFHKVFALTVLFSEICSIFNDTNKLRVYTIIYKHTNT